MKLHKLISTVDMSHEEWLRYRKLGIGGSDAGSICGLNPYSSAIAVFQDKTQKEAEEKEDNEAMRQGRDLEEYVARRFMEETGKKVRRANAIYGHPDHDFMMKTDFVMQMSNDESIKSEINVDMSEVVNEQEDPNIIDQEYKEVENEQSEQ